MDSGYIQFHPCNRHPSIENPGHIHQFDDTFPSGNYSIGKSIGVVAHFSCVFLALPHHHPKIGCEISLIDHWILHQIGTFQCARFIGAFWTLQGHSTFRGKLYHKQCACNNHLILFCFFNYISLGIPFDFAFRQSRPIRKVFQYATWSGIVSLG